MTEERYIEEEQYSEKKEHCSEPSNGNDLDSEQYSESREYRYFGQNRQDGQVSYGTQYPANESYPESGLHPDYTPASHELYGEYRATKPQRERFSIRMITIPLLGVAVHLLLLNLFALLGTVVYNRVYGIPSGLRIDQVLMQAAPWVQAFSTVLLLVTAVPLYGVYLYSREKGHPGHLLKEPFGKADDLLRIVIYAAASLVLTQGFLALLQSLSAEVDFLGKAFEDYSRIVDLISGGSVPFWFNFAALVIAAPIAEELLFRGIIMGEWMRAMPDWLNVLLQGLLFGLFHLNVLQSAYVIIPGLFLGAVYLKTKNILAPITLHMIFNFCGGILPDIYQDNETAITRIFIIEFAVMISGFVYLAVRQVVAKRKVMQQDD